MKVTKKQLVEIISEEIQQALGEVGRGIPVGGGEALTCAEAGAKAGAAYAKANPKIAESVVRVSVQQKGAKKQIKGEYSALLDNAAKKAMQDQNRLSCQEGPEGMRAMDAFRDAFLKVANEEHAMGFASASAPTSGAQIKTDRRTRGYDHIAAEAVTKVEEIDDPATYYAKKQKECREAQAKLTAAKEKLKGMPDNSARLKQANLVQDLEKAKQRACYTGD
tara:strand:- start:2452 stop:3114 length:663 start_codon:yes stop_codon:yes gene_type:complete